ncbi:MAG: asparaginase [Rubrobacter sp.]|nr:asparaginase [Rubrobacter sp.]
MTKFPDDAPLVAIKRGGLVESVHRGRIVFCDPEGNVLEAAGDPDGCFFPRSAMKPFQAVPLILSGAADAFGLSDEELAIACASHKGEERHVETVRSLLRKAGLSEDALDNGAHPPSDAASADALARDGKPFRKVHGNCSGKHAGMVAVCAHEGWDAGAYREPGHPLQVWIRSLLAKACGLSPEELIPGGDGCGAPAFAMPMKNFSTAFARLAMGENLPEDVARAAFRLRVAMRSHPFMVSGTGGFDTEVMENTDLVAKGGAGGVWAAGSGEGWGMAVKISDGAGRAGRSSGVGRRARAAGDRVWGGLLPGSRPSWRKGGGDAPDRSARKPGEMASRVNEYPPPRV